MTNHQQNYPKKPNLLPSFASTFMEDHARRMITDPKIALIEIVANCWDAGADRVDIIWPEFATPEAIEIRDNGIGMTYEQFTQRWLQLNYNRIKMQGEDVEFPPDNRQSHRKVFGRNGKGRHSMFCFASEYFVETWRDGVANKFKIKRTSDTMNVPYSVELISKFEKKGHGTAVSMELARNFLTTSVIHDLIGSKFITDPTFHVYLNEHLVELTSLMHLLNTQQISIPEIAILW